MVSSTSNLMAFSKDQRRYARDEYVLRRKRSDQTEQHEGHGLSHRVARPRVVPAAGSGRRRQYTAEDEARPVRAYPNNCYTCCMNTTYTKTTTKRTRARTPNNRTTTSFRISDELWRVLEPLLPVHVNTHRFGGGRPRVPDQLCADAIFYVLRTGCQWEALNQTELCAKSTAYDRFRQWVDAGVFLKLWQAGLEQFDELKGLDWDWLSMDGALSKAPLGGKKNRPQSH